jgi:hypothetical protein
MQSWRATVPLVLESPTEERRPPPSRQHRSGRIYSIERADVERDISIQLERPPPKTGYNPLWEGGRVV